MRILSRIFGSGQDPLEELDKILEGLETGTLHCNTARERLLSLDGPIRAEVNRSDFLHRKFRTQRAGRFVAAFKMVEQLLDMTSFDNNDLDSFHCVRVILNEHQRSIYGNEYWVKLLYRKGQLVALYKCTCRVCGFEYLYADVSEHAHESPLFCESCGDVTMVAWDHKEEEGATRCKCGGTLYGYGRYVCPRCNGPTDRGAALSCYQYFQNHNYYKYPLKPGTRQRIVREDPDT